MNLCLAIALLDIFSVLRGPLKDEEVACGHFWRSRHFSAENTQFMKKIKIVFNIC
jgi:hypothetical protein